MIKGIGCTGIMGRLALLKGEGESEGLFRELAIWLRTPHLNPLALSKREAENHRAQFI
jgi:hypothetical protein